MNRLELREQFLKRGGNGRTLLELQAEIGLEFFRVPFESVEYMGTVIVKVEEGLLEVPYQMINIEGSLEEFVIGAEVLIDKERVRHIQEKYASQQKYFQLFCKPW